MYVLTYVCLWKHLRGTDREQAHKHRVQAQGKITYTRTCEHVYAHIHTRMHICRHRHVKEEAKLTAKELAEYKARRKAEDDENIRLADKKVAEMMKRDKVPMFECVRACMHVCMCVCMKTM
jgi:hypothetical protein